MYYKYVIWDIDGTLLNTTEGVVGAVNDTFRKEKLPLLTPLQEKILMGSPKIQEAFINLYDVDFEQALILANKYREIYKDKYLLKASEYDGISDIMTSLVKHGIIQSIVTNKREDYAITICRHFNFHKYCSPILGSDGTPKAEKSERILKCLELLKVSDKKQAVMVGDTLGDKTAAEHAGIDFIGVNYGFGFKNIKGYANSPIEILDLLRSKKIKVL